MLAIFGIGLIELIILGVIALGGLIALVVVIAAASQSKGRREE